MIPGLIPDKIEKITIKGKSFERRWFYKDYILFDESNPKPAPKTTEEKESQTRSTLEKVANFIRSIKLK